ncbi:MAG: class I SAM-dependent methyltransferase [Candidatus Omnitrophica bacterium]|nr:class I SAM-dependent methyltransferase [Candidatus Omnitrophota bacterium]
MKGFLLKIWLKGERSNYNNVLSVLEYNPNAVVLDCGCGNGEFTLRAASKIGVREIFGIEIDEELANVAKAKGIKVKQADLNKKIPFDDASFDVVIANQLIEHLFDTDNFVDEIYRILRRGGTQ